MKFSDKHKNNLSKAKIGTKQNDKHKTMRAIGATGKIISINGILYGTYGIASRETGISIRTLGRRLKDRKFPNIIHVKYKNQNNIVGLV